MDLGYKFVLHENAFRFALATRAAQRKHLSAFFRTLAEDPYRRGDFQETDANGREMEVTLHGRFLITYWTDHAVKEVRISRIDFVKSLRNL